MKKTQYPFEAPYAEIEATVDVFIDAVFHTLQSSFLLLPRGPGFVTYRDFQQAYEVLKRHTAGFSATEPKNVMDALQEQALAFVVLRTVLGFTPPELAYVAARSPGLTYPRILLALWTAEFGLSVRYSNLLPLSIKNASLR